MRMFIAAAIALIATPALATAAEDWFRVGGTPEGVVVSLDMNSVQRKGDVVNVWARHDYSAVKNPKYGELRVRTAYDCAARTAQVKEAFVYGTDGSEVSHFTWEADESPVDPAKPGTISETSLDKVCVKPVK